MELGALQFLVSLLSRHHYVILIKVLAQIWRGPLLDPIFTLFIFVQKNLCSYIGISCFVGHVFVHILKLTTYFCNKWFGGLQTILQFATDKYFRIVISTLILGSTGLSSALLASSCILVLKHWFYCHVIYALFYNPAQNYAMILIGSAAATCWLAI